MVERQNPEEGSATTVLNVGDTVEDFTALDHEGNQVSLGQLLADGPLVVYFYIKAKTPG